MLHAGVPGAGGVGAGDDHWRRRREKWRPSMGHHRGEAGREPVNPRPRAPVRARWELDVDFESRYMLAPLHPDNDLIRIERYVPRDRGEDFRAQPRQQIRLLAAQAALMRQQDLQPLPRDRRGSISAAEDAATNSAHAALRPSSRFIRPLRSVGTVMETVSPISRRAASMIGAGRRAGGLFSVRAIRHLMPATRPGFPE